MSERGAGSVGGFRGHPRGLPMLFFTEFWERFSYYGMRALLVLFMVEPATGGGLGLASGEAARLYGNYTMAVYLLAIPGGYLADALLGARWSVLAGGSVIALGHYVLAIPSSSTFLLGLTLVALGTGLFKPNISALVGRLYAEGDPRRDGGFSLFYMGINLGAFIAPLVTGYLAQSDGFKSALAAHGFDPARSWHWGFGAAALGMTAAMVIFARHWHELPEPPTEPHELPADLRTWKAGLSVVIATGGLLTLTWLSDREGLEVLRLLFVALPAAAALYFSMQENAAIRRLAAVAVLFIASMLFWAVFEQAGLSISLFADRLTRTEMFGWSFPSAWFQSLNALFVILLAPVFAALWTGMGDAQPSAPMKFVIGLALLAASFLMMVPAAHLASTGAVSPLWLVGLFLLQTLGELCLSPVGLSTMTKLAPHRLSGLVLGVWFLGVAFGNKLAGVFGSRFNADDPAALPEFFLSLGLLVLAGALVLLVLTPWVKRLMAGPSRM